jgi:hypothetical protein
MKKSKLLIILAAMLVGTSSCGIFHKGCGCPHFGKVKTNEFKNFNLC